MGQLKYLYRIAHVVFIGKSLVGRGGQNMIEPAFFEKAVLVGPYTDNFKEVVEAFIKQHAIVQVRDQEALLVNVRRLLQNPETRQELGKKAKHVILENRGATGKTIDILKEFLSKKK